MIIVDTNVWSETTKRRVDELVLRWLRDREGQTLLSTIVIGELRQGLTLTSGSANRARLDLWLDDLLQSHLDRVLAFDTRSALAWGELAAVRQLAGRPVPPMDSLLAAQALAHGVAIATRNVSHFDIDGVELINPWDA